MASAINPPVTPLYKGVAKFQLDVTGKNILITTEEEGVFAELDAEMAGQVAKALKLTILTKKYREITFFSDGTLEIGAHDLEASDYDF